MGRGRWVVVVRAIHDDDDDNISMMTVMMVMMMKRMMLERMVIDGDGDSHVDVDYVDDHGDDDFDGVGTSTVSDN